LVLLLIKLSFPYDKAEEAMRKRIELISKFPLDPDLVNPKPVQPMTAWILDEDIMILNIFEVRKGKLKEAIDLFNYRRQYWPTIEGYRFDICISYMDRRRRPYLLRQKKLSIFVSYATKDAQVFKIREMAEILRGFPEIKNVLYWQEHMHDNIFKFMNDNIGKCDIMLLFCSEKALNSKPVEKEWTAAEAIDLPIIPIFSNLDHIPPLLKSRLGMEYDFNDMDKNIKELRSLIFKKIGRPEE
jgi:hypothetical protein